MRDIRKLAWISCGFSLSILLAHYIIPHSFHFALAGLSLLLSCAALLFKDLKRKRALVFLLAMAVGFGYYGVKYNINISASDDLGEEKISVSARVTDYPEQREGYRLINVRFTDDALPRINGLIIDYGEERKELRPGDEIRLCTVVKSADERFGERTDVNISKGLYLIGYAENGIEKIGHWNKSFMYFPKYLGGFLRSEIRELFPENTRAFFLALLTGDKSEYYADDKLSGAMSISGLSHIVAVSGMHIAFLVGFLQLCMGKNRKSTIVCLSLIWIFVIMVGAPPSAVRAGFMQSVLLAAPIFDRKNDYATSLSFALAIILALNPFAIGSIGLQLSFGAMAGILLFTKPVYNGIWERVKSKNPVIREIMHYAIGVLSSSLGVSIITIPLIAIHFGYVSLYAVFANILCIWAVSLAFCGGYIAVFLNLLWHLGGKIIAAVVSCLVRYISLVVKYTVKLPFAALYTENRLVILWLLLSYAMFALCYAVARKKTKILIPTVGSLVCLAALLLSIKVMPYKDAGSISVLSVGNGQCIVLTEKNSTTVIDCGSSGTFDSAGDTAISYLKAGGRDKIDCLLLTHLHSDHANGAEHLINFMNVDKLILPANAADNDEDGLLDSILLAARENGTSVYYISENERITDGEISLSIYAPSDVGDKNERGLMLTAKLNGYDVLITGDANKSVERKLAENEDLSGTELLIVGHHGSKNSCCAELLDAAEPESAIISVGYNSYGHPANSVLRRLGEREIEYLRTDLCGNIVIHTA